MTALYLCLSHLWVFGLGVWVGIKAVVWAIGGRHRSILERIARMK